MGRSLKSTCIVLLLLQLQARDSPADLINWSAATNTSSSSDISLNGTLELAFNGGASTTTVNGVTFTASSVLGNTASGILAGGDTGDASLNTLLDQFTFGSGTGDVVFDIGSFVSGDTYEVQVFYTDQRSVLNDRVMRFDDDGIGTNGFVDLEADPDNTIGGPFGQYAIGTFVSDGTDLNLVLNAQGFANAHITAWQVRNITTTPEPTSGILLLMLLSAVGLRTRHR